MGPRALTPPSLAHFGGCWGSPNKTGRLVVRVRTVMALRAARFARTCGCFLGVYVFLTAKFCLWLRPL